MVELLLKYGADPNAAFYLGETPLIIAMSKFSQYCSAFIKKWCRSECR